MNEGWENQETGDWGEALVLAELVKNGYTVIKLDPDPGEDFLVELDGREAVAKGLYPRRALIQVRAHSKSSNTDIFRESLSLKAIVRWSSQPLPVYIVSVCGKDEPLFFEISLQDLLTDALHGRDPVDIDQETVTVALRKSPALAKDLSISIEAFTRLLVPDFEGLTAEEIDANHFEVVRERSPTVYQKAIHVGLSVLWKSPRRPQYMSAMLRELVKRLQLKHVGTDRPVFATFHVYRSLKDMHHNMAVVHIDWIDRDHPEFMNVSDTFEWAPFRVRAGHDSDESRKYLATRTASVEEYVMCIEMIGSLLDDILPRHPYMAYPIKPHNAHAPRERNCE
jgi:hypothetical protein